VTIPAAAAGKSPGASDLPGLPAADLADAVERYRRMTLIRHFEERVSKLYRDGAIPGFVHVSIGQEATAVGATWPLQGDDVITSTHRGHGHALAKGLHPFAAFAELMARDSGACRGRGGSMHLAAPQLGIFGANGIVGAGVPIATGAALASQLRERRQVIVAFIGDGAVSTGSFHEATNLAALWRLPLVVLCENNHYSEFTPTAKQHPVPFPARAAAYGLPYFHVEGNDVEAVTRCMTGVCAEIRSGGGPVFIEAETHRFRGHYEGDPERYRDTELDQRWQAADPLAAARAALLAQGLTAEFLDAIDTRSADVIRDAEERALAAPAPDDTSLFEFMLAPRSVAEHEAAAQQDRAEPGPPQSVSRTIRSALEYELEHDQDVVLFGIDVGESGNVFAITRGLYERWPDRVRDTPISEMAIVGAGVGAAMAGLRPVVELMYMDFLGVCLDQLLNQAAKLRFMTGGAAGIPLTVRTQFGAGRASGSQHSQSLEAILAHIPGLTVVMPSNHADYYGLLRASIRDPNPVVFVENRLQYGVKGPVPPAGHIVPIGRASVVRPGRDVTLVSWSRMVHECLSAATQLATEGIDVEVIDLRTIQPFDRDCVLSSLAKTNRLVIAQESVTDFGVGAELVALAANEGFWTLDAPIRRVGAPFLPVPYAPNLERLWLPDAARIAACLRQVAAV
jgi:2-oxoisovalerate dehydrogenase E1 component